MTYVVRLTNPGTHELAASIDELAPWREYDLTAFLMENYCDLQDALPETHPGISVRLIRDGIGFTLHCYENTEESAKMETIHVHGVSYATRSHWRVSRLTPVREPLASFLWI
jgi:hypothetical protein